MDLRAQLVRQFAGQEFWDRVQAWAKDDFAAVESDGRRVVKEVLPRARRPRHARAPSEPLSRRHGPVGKSPPRRHAPA